MRVRPVDVTGLLTAIVYIDLVGANKDEARNRLLEGIKSKNDRKKPDSEPDFDNLF